MSDGSVTADVLPVQVIIWIRQELLPERPDSTLRCERLNRPNARPEVYLTIGRTEAEEYNVNRVPADSKLEGFVSRNEPMFADASPRWDELNQVLECRRCGRFLMINRCESAEAITPASEQPQRNARSDAGIGAPKSPSLFTRIRLVALISKMPIIRVVGASIVLEGELCTERALVIVPLLFNVGAESVAPHSVLSKSGDRCITTSSKSLEAFKNSGCHRPIIMVN